ncbi:31226_t:CDS:2, partial [Racocetra persica]
MLNDESLSTVCNDQIDSLDKDDFKNQVSNPLKQAQPELVYKATWLDGKRIIKYDFEHNYDIKSRSSPCSVKLMTLYCLQTNALDFVKE